MKRLIAVLLLVVAAPSFAQSICRSYEYAELKDMPRDGLAQLYCTYRSNMHAMMIASLSNAERGYMRASDRDLGDANRCAQELERIERVLSAQYQLKMTGCSPIAR